MVRKNISNLKKTTAATATKMCLEEKKEAKDRFFCNLIKIRCVHEENHELIFR